eukprot:5422644-Pleurochrysis_carterae.AAC.1
MGVGTHDAPTGVAAPAAFFGDLRCRFELSEGSGGGAGIDGLGNGAAPGGVAGTSGMATGAIDSMSIGLLVLIAVLPFDT